MSLNHKIKKQTTNPMGDVLVKPFIMKSMRHTVNHGIATGVARSNIIHLDDLFAIIRDTYPSTDWNNPNFVLTNKSITFVSTLIGSKLTTSFGITYKLNGPFTSVKLPFVEGMFPIMSENPLMLQLAFDWYDTEQRLTYPSFVDPSTMVANNFISMYDGMPARLPRVKNSISRRKSRANRVSNKKPTKDKVAAKPVTRQSVRPTSNQPAVKIAKDKPSQRVKSPRTVDNQAAVKPIRTKSSPTVPKLDQELVLHGTRTRLLRDTGQSTTPNNTDVGDMRQFAVFSINTSRVTGYLVKRPFFASVRPRFSNGYLKGLDFALCKTIPTRIVINADISASPFQTVNGYRIVSDDLYEAHFFRYEITDRPSKDLLFLSSLVYDSCFDDSEEAPLNHSYECVIGLYQRLYKLQHPELSPSDGSTPEEYERR